MRTCVTGKIRYLSEALAVEALLDAWVRHAYTAQRGPVNVYLCDACGQYHFTSKGSMHARLAEALASGTIEKLRTARNWEDRWRNK
jgi:hypothetical protein